MKLTQHAKDHIFDRTLMTDKDVLDLVSGGGVYTLGSHDDYEYLLFWSPFDKHHKIAVVGSNRTALVSIWETYFTLPQGILQVTKRVQKKARTAYQAYVVGRLPKKVLSPEEEAALDTPYFAVKFDVERNERVEYTHDCGLLSLRQGKSAEVLIESILPQLGEVASIVEANRARFAGAICYVITRSTLAAVRWQHISLNHKKLMKKLRAVP